ncbi:PhoH family protein [Lyngbya confervoides]|uniref:PhoH family protein n=1 Tax=Lyngbya confervoides BDU141951 TaxID=1574623 RepID=A0ABD4T0Z8_9CYAN|nr:PhoH family protein [Lyngbya confervoides]MCM1982321.1 PhoH family protein [Lyngbya confervoides BDU141951]
MKKVYVLDTNVLLHDPAAMLRFEDNDVVLPITIIEELDRFKKHPEEMGRNARQVSRTLDDLRQRASLTQKIPLDNGGTLQVALCHKATVAQLPPGLEGDSGDNAILATALELQRQCQCPVVLVSKDTNLRIKADALGLAAEDYETDKIDFDDLYTGVQDLLVDADYIQALFKDGSVDLPQAQLPNQAITLIDQANPQHTALGTVSSSGTTLTPIPKFPHNGISRIHPRNKEQKFALALLLNDQVPLVTLVGRAGTGKTLLAIAAGLQKVADEKVYHRLLIARPIIPMGKDLGYLPGDITEKMTPWMQPLYDNLDLILGTQAPTAHKPAHWRRGHEELMEQGLLQIEALTYIRGRSIPQQFLIVDEAQNLTPHEVKTILTRAGEGTKVVLTGDTDQIDNPYVDAASNGLTYAVERFKAEPLAAHITLRQGERSQLAERAVMLL